MALKYTGKLITGTEVFAMSEGITTTSFHVPKKSALATQMNDGERTLYIIKAGTPVPSNDADCIGLVFENWDVTDDGGNIPIAISGNVNEHYAPVTYDAACKSALKNVNLHTQPGFHSMSHLRAIRLLTAMLPTNSTGILAAPLAGTLLPLPKQARRFMPSSLRPLIPVPQFRREAAFSST